MGRLFLFIGIILTLAGPGLMIAVFSVQDIPFIQDILVEQYCEPGESITHARGASLPGANTYSDIWYCDDNEGNQREITGQIAVTGIVLFVAPFLIGMILIFAGEWTIFLKHRLTVSQDTVASDLDVRSLPGV